METHLISPGKGNGPLLKSADEFLARDIALRIPNDTPGDNKGKNARAAAVRQLGEPVQKCHITAATASR